MSDKANKATPMMVLSKAAELRARMTPRNYHRLVREAADALEQARAAVRREDTPETRAALETANVHAHAALLAMSPEMICEGGIQLDLAEMALDQLDPWE